MGSWKGNSDPPGQDESISKGYWPYGINSPLQPSLNTIELDIVHPKVKQCFLKCFNDGHKSPTSRPSPQEWVDALYIAIKDLEACSRINNHIYSRSYGKCYWCERTARLRVDIFPAVKQPIFPPSASPKPIKTQPVVKTQPSPIKPSSSSSNVDTVIFWVVVIIVLLVIAL